MPFQKKCCCISLMTRSLDQASRSVLYKNILQYVNPSTEVYQALCAGNGAVCHGAAACRQDERLHLAVIYEHMLYTDMIDARAAGDPAQRSLCSSRVKCDDPCHEIRDRALRGAGGRKRHFYWNMGKPMCRLVSKNTVLFFQDARMGAAI